MENKEEKKEMNDARKQLIAFAMLGGNARRMFRKYKSGGEK